MKIWKMILSAMVLSVLVAGPVFAEAAKSDDVLGTFVDADGDSNIEIYKCGQLYCGKIIWLKEPLNSKGEPKVDGENPDAKLKTRPIQGLVLLTGFKFDGEETWKNGKIYNPKNGKTYDCQMTMDGNKLNIRGYILGMPFLGETTVWTRK